MASTTKRHPAEITGGIGCTRTTAAHRPSNSTADFDTGAYASWGPTVANRVPVHATGPYRVIPAMLGRWPRLIYTNAPPSQGAFRGFGVPQSAIWSTKP